MIKFEIVKNKILGSKKQNIRKTMKLKIKKGKNRNYKLKNKIRNSFFLY